MKEIDYSRYWRMGFGYRMAALEVRRGIWKDFAGLDIDVLRAKGALGGISWSWVSGHRGQRKACIGTGVHGTEY